MGDNLPLVVDQTTALDLITGLASHIISSQGTEKKLQSSYFLQSVARLANELSLSLRARSMDTNESKQKLRAKTNKDKGTPPSDAEVISQNYTHSSTPMIHTGELLLDFFMYKHANDMTETPVLFEFVATPQIFKYTAND